MEKQTYVHFTRYYHVTPTDWIPAHPYSFESKLIDDNTRKQYADGQMFTGCSVEVLYNHNNKIDKVIAHELDRDGNRTAFMVVVEFEEVEAYEKTY